MYLEIEHWFSDGETQCKLDWPKKIVTPCPYKDEISERWWTRGYAYSARLLRATEAEAKLEERDRNE